MPIRFSAQVPNWRDYIWYDVTYGIWCYAGICLKMASEARKAFFFFFAEFLKPTSYFCSFSCTLQHLCILILSSQPVVPHHINFRRIFITAAQPNIVMLRIEPVLRIQICETTWRKSYLCILKLHTRMSQFWNRNKLDASRIKWVHQCPVFFILGCILGSFDFLIGVFPNS